MYIKFTLAQNIIVAVDATEEKIMARSQQNSAGNKTATKSKKSTQTKSVSKSGAKNCSNCSNCK